MDFGAKVHYRFTKKNTCELERECEAVKGPQGGIRPDETSRRNGAQAMESVRSRGGTLWHWNPRGPEERREHKVSTDEENADGAAIGAKQFKVVSGKTPESRFHVWIL